MPATEVVYYQERDGSVPVLEYLATVGKKDRRPLVKCWTRLDALRELGHELRRPVADYLRDGIYELRIQAGRVQHRLLYFFHGKDVVILVHGLTKERQVPNLEIERAVERKRRFDRAPLEHAFRMDMTNG